MIFSGLSQVPRHLIELIKAAVAEPSRQCSEQPDLSSILLDRKIHQQGFQHIEEHIQGKEDSHECVNVGLVLRAIETAHYYHPNDPVDQGKHVNEVLAIAWKVESNCSTDVAHYYAAYVSRDGE